MIPTKKDSDGLYDIFRNIYEHCYFCDTPTKYLHVKTSRAVCQECSKIHKVSELEKTPPNYKHKFIWIR